MVFKFKSKLKFKLEFKFLNFICNLVFFGLRCWPCGWGVPLFHVEHLSANPTKWSNTLKQFLGDMPTNCLSVFDHFVGLALKGFIDEITHTKREHNSHHATNWSIIRVTFTRLLHHISPILNRYVFQNKRYNIRKVSIGN